MKITLDQVCEWRPCCAYRLKDKKTIDRKKLLQISGGRTELTPLEIAALPIPPLDALWLLLRREIIPEKDLHLLSCDFAETALPIWEAKYLEDNRPREAIETKRRWVRGEATDDDLAAAVAAADSASAASAAAWAAASAAARDAAMAAASAAARDAARAVWAATYAATGKKFLAMTVEVLKRLEADNAKRVVYGKG